MANSKKNNNGDTSALEYNEFDSLFGGLDIATEEKPEKTWDVLQEELGETVKEIEAAADPAKLQMFSGIFNSPKLRDVWLKACEE